ncbi:hypothetical protein MAPG_10854 [Magnaporthiopsis poae ATCC 64411]|uniref:BHLH domain-containing protein n=1 Tax=Magnaporthiopsis poae (strain ATCC 64411 / 73-15) TaxID=644358 RepID=A0A0C4EDP8_MAGP6|nr:hypothetical protein MAPG_10854 [Magnaporthiopsis poae ATCC 64411]
MLAIQRPRMGSTQPSDPDLPFGYALDPSQEFLFLDAPEPAPGAPLLNENDARFLNSFFEDMTSDHFAGTSFGEGLNFSEDWLSLPPQFMGTATTFGQHPGAGLGSPIHSLTNVTYEPLSSPSALMPPPPPPHIQSAPPPPPPPLQQHQHHQQPSQVEFELGHTSDDVLAAATLLQNSSMQRPHGHGSAPNGHNSYGGGVSLEAPPVEHVQNHGVVGYRDDNRHGSQAPALEEHESAYPEMVFDGQNGVRQTIATPPRPNNPPTVQVRWGSDSSFNKVGFVPNSTKETGEALETERLKYIECFEVATGKRRKSSANGAAKPPRENLTDEQKRENHIKSEQKRRTLIKEGFDDLCDLVPGLKGGGFSKSTMLTMAADWLEEIMRGNEELRQAAQSYN